MKEGYVIHCEPDRFLPGNTQAMTVDALRIEANLITASIRTYYPERRDPQEISYFRWKDPGINLGEDYVFFETDEGVTCFSELSKLFESNLQLSSEIIEARTAAENADYSAELTMQWYFSGAWIALGAAVIFATLKYFAKRKSMQYR